MNFNNIFTKVNGSSNLSKINATQSRYYATKVNKSSYSTYEPNFVLNGDPFISSSPPEIESKSFFRSLAAAFGLLSLTIMATNQPQNDYKSEKTLKKE